MKKFFDKVKRIWALADYEPVENSGDLVVENKKTAILVKAPKQSAVFIPYNKKTPAQEIVEQANEPTP